MPTPLLSPDNIFLSLLLVAPGFIAVLIAIIFGVVERDIPDSQLLGVSIVSSVIIDWIFLIIVQVVFGETIESAAAIKNLFFNPEFRPLYVGFLLSLSVVLGLIYTIILIGDHHEHWRDNLWEILRQDERKRTPWQPWQGTLRDAYLLRVHLSEGDKISGSLKEYSRVGKPRQLALHDPEWYNPETDSFEDAGVDSIILFEDDIERVEIIMTETQKEEWNEQNKNNRVQ